MKKCSTCGKIKEESNFYKNSSNLDGLDDCCKECRRRHSKNNYRKHKKQCLKSTQRWREKHREQYNEYVNNYITKKKKNNPQFKLNTNMSRSIWEAIKGKKNGRHWETFVDYTLNDLMKHLEQQFESWMTWDNYGEGWHIDHIIPQSHFNFDSPKDKEFKRCWALENLQPLEAKKNIKKGNSLNHNNSQVES